MNEISLIGFRNRGLLEDQVIGLRVRTLRDFVGVPKGTEGVVDEVYDLGGHKGIMVAWDLADSPLPPGYRAWDGRASYILRDGFGADETNCLEVVA